MCIENVVVCMIGKGQRLPLRGQRAAHCEEAGYPGLEHPLVHAERHGRFLSLAAQRGQPLDDGGVGVRPEQPVAEQLEPGRHRPADDRRAHDQPVAPDQPLPKPPGIVRLGALGGAAWQAELVEPDELHHGAFGLGGPQRRLEQDLRAAVRLAAAQPEHRTAHRHRSVLLLLAWQSAAKPCWLYSHCEIVTSIE